MAFDLQQTPGGGVQFVDEASGAYGSIVMALGWNVNRGTTNTLQVGWLPANARIARIDVQVPVVSNAATTANVSVGLLAGSATYFSAAQDVKTAVGTFSQTATANWVPSGVKQAVTCTYTETGGASTTGNIYVTVFYTVL